MTRAYLYRLYPTAAQRTYMEQVFGANRWVWNWALQRRHETYAMTGKSLSWGELSKELTQLKKQPETAWLTDMPSWSIQQPIRNLHAAFDRFFGKKARYPKFKSKRRSRASFQNYACRTTKRGILLAKIGETRVNWHRVLPFDAIIKTVTVSRDSAQRYWVSIQVTTNEPTALQPIEECVGVDLGLVTLATLSTGEKIPNLRLGKAQAKRLARSQRVMARQEKGSKKRRKTQLRVAKLHAKVANQRRDYLHKVTTRLVRENQAIAIEDLSVRGMSNCKRQLGRSLSDASFTTFRSMLAYKCDWYGRELLLVDRYYPSSKTCSACGHLLERLDLGQREWTCPTCNTFHDRDVNAAKNILAAGSAVTASGGRVRPELASAGAGDA